jgi:hypothetical protein
VLGEVPSVIPKSESTSNPSETKPAARPRTSLVLVVALIIIAGLAFGAVVHSSSGSVQYACMTINHQGNNVDVTTSGLIHVSGSDIYLSCSEGSPLPTSSTSVSCLTVNPQLETPPYPGAASTYYYHLTTSTGSITLQGAAANTTEVTPPSSVSILVTC